MADVKRPLASTVGVLKVKSVSMKTLTSEQGEKPAMPPGMEYSMSRGASICNDNPQGMACTFHNGPCFEAIVQQLSAATDADKSKSTDQLANKQFQLVPEVCYFPDGLDSDSDDNSDAEYGLGLGEQVLIIELLAGNELSSEQ